jgi:hypothetical protein
MHRRPGNLSITQFYSKGQASALMYYHLSMDTIYLPKYRNHAFYGPLYYPVFIEVPQR